MVKSAIFYTPNSKQLGKNSKCDMAMVSDGPQEVPIQVNPDDSISWPDHTRQSTIDQQLSDSRPVVDLISMLKISTTGVSSRTCGILVVAQGSHSRPRGNWQMPLSSTTSPKSLKEIGTKKVREKTRSTRETARHVWV